MKNAYHKIDLRNFTLGRAASKAAFLLSGKHKRSYSPNIDNNDFVLAINSDSVQFTGRKEEKKIKHKFSGYPGGISSKKLGKAMADDSRKVFFEAVYGMLPKNKLRDKRLKRLLIFKDEKHNLDNKLIK